MTCEIRIYKVFLIGIHVSENNGRRRKNRFVDTFESRAQYINTHGLECIASCGPRVASA